MFDIREMKNTLLQAYNKPVSYTHLDVYKRQVYFISRIKPHIFPNHGFYFFKQ